MTESYLKQNKVVSHCWSPDGQFVALSIKNTSNVDVFQIGNIEKVGTWKKVYTFKDASQAVNALSWSIDNKIVVGSDDRSVYVYRSNANSWTKDLVVCRNEKAIVTGEWSPNGQKFVLGSACHHAYILFFDKKNNWWSDLQISGFYSTVTACRFHPSGRAVGLGSADQTFKLISCVVEDQGKITLEHEDAAYNGLLSNINTFGEILLQVNMNGWVNAIDFTPNKFAVASHTGQIRQYQLKEDGTLVDEGEKNILNVRETKPYNKILYVSETTLIGVGYDRKPVLFDVANGIKFTQIIEKSLANEGDAAKSGMNAARQMFQGKGQQTEDKTAHQTAINCINKVSDTLISTSDVNGIINFWRI